MENNEDALDDSAEEITVNHENPITTEAAPPAKGRNGSAAHSAPFEGIAISVCSPSTDQSEPWEEVDEGDTRFAKKNFAQRPAVGSAKAIVCIIVELPLDRLVSHPENKMLFGATSPNEIEELAESIMETGQQSPIIVTADLEKVGYYTIISGHKRADALRSMGRRDANCQLEDIKDADDRLLRLLEANRQHVPTTEQKIRIGEVYFGFETKKAKARQVAGAKAAKKSGEVVEVFTQPTPPPTETGGDTAGKARDLAAAKVGMSGVSFDKGRKVLRAMEKAETDEKKASVVSLRELLNEKGIDPAYEHAKVLNLIEKVSKQGGMGSKAQGNGVEAKGVGAAQDPDPNAVDPEDNPPAPVSASTVVKPDDTDKATVFGEIPPLVSRQAEEVADDAEQPLGVRAIAIGKKFVEALAAVDVGDLTLDQKGNLVRTLDDVSDWQANHDQMLKLPGQL